MSPEQAEQIIRDAQLVVGGNPRLLKNPQLLRLITQAMDVLQAQRQSGQEAPIEPLMAKFRELWQMARGKLQPFAEFVVTNPDAAVRDAGRNPDMMRAIVERLKREAIPQQQPQDGIEPAPIGSSNVWGFRYDPRNRRLFVRFNNGNVYSYEGVPQQIFNSFRQGAAAARTTGRNRWGSWWTGKTPSLGAAVWKYLRDSQIPYTRII